MTDQKRLRLAGCVIFLLAFLFIEALEFIMRPYAAAGFYFQPWSSEAMVQTVPLQDLRDAPLVSLYYIHIQPPGFDALRALLVALLPAADIGASIRNVDAALYWLWAILFALMGVLVFVWCSALIGLRAAWIVSLLFLFHPATIFYATLLDSTFLSALLVLLLYYLLWRIKNGFHVSIILLSFVVLGLFFFRSIFQWPAILLFALCLYLLKVPTRKLLLFLLLAGGISGLYVAKQYYLFHLASTSSFTGLNLMNSIGLHQDYALDPAQEEAALSTMRGQLPDVLTRIDKATGAINFNNVVYLQRNRQLTGEFFASLRHMSPGTLIRAYWENALIYFEPSSSYWQNAIVDRLPWRPLYDLLFSAPLLPLLLLLSLALWVLRTIRLHHVREGVALLLPALYIFLVCILFERGENMRFKYFLEPLMFTFIAAQFYPAVRDFYRRVLRKDISQPSPSNVA